MDWLVQAVVQRTGLSEATARQAVTVILEQIKTRLPAGMSNQLDGYLSGQGLHSGRRTRTLGDFFGRKAG